MIEVAISTVVIGLLMLAAVSAAGRAARNASVITDRVAGTLHAGRLMAEILQQPYLDPGTSPVFGPEADEDPCIRGDFDDVDDYHGWKAGPPQNKAGAVLSDLAGWEESVTVAWCSPLNPGVDAASDLGIKRITVTVYHHGAEVASLTALRTAAFSALTRPGSPDSETNTPPAAGFSWEEVSGTGGLRVRFDAGASDDDDAADAGFLTFLWDFGDGTVAGGRTVEHTYAAEGTYVVTLTVIDGRGGLATAVQSIEVPP